MNVSSRGTRGVTGTYDFDVVVVDDVGERIQGAGEGEQVGTRMLPPTDLQSHPHVALDGRSSKG